MRVLISIQHPSSVHFFANAISSLQKKGHQLHITVRERGICSDLLDAYGINHSVLVNSKTKIKNLTSQPIYELKLLIEAQHFEPDVITERVGLAASHVGGILGIPSLGWTDNDRRITHELTLPFITEIHTPMGLSEDFGPKHHRYKGIKELAYLHPNTFKPDPGYLKEKGLDPSARYIIINHGDFSAHHDVSNKGISKHNMEKIRGYINKNFTVYHIGDFNSKYSEYELPIPPEGIHHALFFADLLITDTKTLAVEAACLGTTAIRYRSLGKSFEYLNDFHHHGLLFEPRTQDELLNLLSQDISKLSNNQFDKWVGDVPDVTKYIIEQITKFR